MLSRASIWCMGCLLGCSGLAAAADYDVASLQAVVDKAVEKYRTAFQARDATGLAALFTPEAELVDITGTVFHGRDAIAAEYAAAFETQPPGEIEIEILSIRPIADGLLVEEGVSTFRDAAGQFVARTHYTATHVRQSDGSWLLASVRELEAPASTPHEQLLALSWLEGAWREEIDGGSVSTTWKWSPDGNFLISEFSLHNAQGEAITGSHRIGWDGERRQYRSWIFDANGGAADGWWTAGDDGSWSVQFSGVDGDGARLSCLLTYFHDGADGLVLTQEQRSLGGVALPSTTHRVVRQPPAPE